MGIRESLDFIIEKIESIQPKSDIYHGFISNQKGKGGGIQLENRQNSRYFDLNFQNFVKDDGEAGVSGRKRADLNIRIIYLASADKHLLDIQMSEDASKIIDALQYPSYSYATTGIISINVSLQNSSISTILNDNGTSIKAYLLTIPLYLLYRED